MKKKPWKLRMYTWEQWCADYGHFQEKPWRAVRYLMRGDTVWCSCWVDTSLHKDPRAYLKARMGTRMVAFEEIVEIEPMSMKQMLDGEMHRVRLPEKREPRRSARAALLQ